MKKRNFYIFLLVSFVLFTFIAGLGRDLWFDEAYSMMTVKTWGFLGPQDVQPFGYYTVLKLWQSAVGDGIFGSRMLSVLFGVGCVGLLYLIVLRLFDNDDFLALMACIVFVLSSSSLYYFTEARMYALGLFFCMLSFYFLLCVVFEGKWFIGLSFSLAVLPLIHYFTAFFVVLLGVFYVFMRMKLGGGNKVPYEDFMWGVPVIVLGWGVAIRYFFLQVGRIEGLYFDYSGFSSVLSTYYSAFFKDFGALQNGSISFVGSVFGFVFIGLCFVVLWQYMCSKDEKRDVVGVLVGAYLVLPILAILLALVVGMNVYNHRFFFFIGWIFIMCVVVALNSFPLKSWKRVVFISLFMLLIFLNLFVFIFDGQNYGIQRMYGAMVADCSKSVIVVHESSFSYFPFKYLSEHDSGCRVNNFVFLEDSLRRVRGIGYDAMDVSEVKFVGDGMNESVLGLPVGAFVVDYKGFWSDSRFFDYGEVAEKLHLIRRVS